MREIKFRAVKATGEVAHFTLNEVLHHKAPTWIYEYPSIVKDGYTGLKDKNGVEVYEGDIVRLSDDSVFSISWREHGCEFVLQNRNGGVHGLWYIENTERGDGIEVIGNIHEHSHLLT